MQSIRNKTWSHFWIVVMYLETIWYLHSSAKLAVLDKYAFLGDRAGGSCSSSLEESTAVDNFAVGSGVWSQPWLELALADCFSRSGRSPQLVSFSIWCQKPSPTNRYPLLYQFRARKETESRDSSFRKPFKIKKENPLKISWHRALTKNLIKKKKKTFVAAKDDRTS